MSLRTVADDTATAADCTTCADPTGWAVSMYSSTTARRMAALRSSSMRTFLALDATECQPSAAGPPAWQPGRMRFVVVGAGAVGGVVGGRLAQHDHDVVLVARGDHGAGDRRRRPPHPLPRRRGAGTGARGVAPVRAHPHRRRRGAPGGEGPGHGRGARGLGRGPARPGDRVPPERRRQRAPGPAPHAEHLRGAGDAPRHLPRARRGGGVLGADHAASSTSAATRRGIDERAEAISTAFATSTFSSLPPAGRHAVQVVEAPHEPRQRARGRGAVRSAARATLYAERPGRGRGRARGGRHRLRVRCRRTPSAAAT